MSRAGGGAAGGGAAGGNKPLKFYQIMLARADGTQYSSIRSEPFGNDAIEIFGINHSASQDKKIKFFNAWMTLAQLAPVMLPLPNAAGELQERREQLTVPFDVIFCSLIFPGLPANIAGDRLLQAANFAALKVNPSLFANRDNAEFQSDLFQVALDAALNADLPILETIVREMSPEQRSVLLSAPGRATITHLDIDRTGTPLQMALYGHDEEMVAVIQRHMDPAEFQRQWEKVFGPDYNAFLERQQQEANRLCSELENAFRAASATDVTNALLHRVANTTSALQDTLNRFKDNLERYVGENIVHNPYILQRLFEIYKSPSFSDWNKNCLLSQQAIGVAQKLSSPRWLQHLSQGLHYLTQDNESTRRSFGFRDSQPLLLDIRSLDRLIVGPCVDIFGVRVGPSGPMRQWRHLGATFIKTYVEQKQQAFQNLLRGERSRLAVA